MTSEKKNSLENNTCPYLGVIDDPNTAMAYPSPHNSCFKIKPAQVPNKDHQSRFCLSSDFAPCPVYLSKGKADEKKYHNIFSKQEKQIIHIFRRYKFLVVLVLLVLLLVWVFSMEKLSIILPFTGRRISTTPTWVQPTIIFEETPVPTAMPIPFKPTPTYKQPEPRFIETPMGKNYMFIVHRVQPGESIASLAETYVTTADAIKAINYGMGDTLWEDKLVVVPFERSNMTDVPPMTAYLVEVEGITINQLAEELRIDLTTLSILNNLPEGYSLTLDEAIIIPHYSP
jgi:hypothetical protein